MLVAARAAGVVQGGGTLERVRAFRKSQLQQHVPDPAHLAGGEGLELLRAARAAGDHDRISQAGEGVFQLLVHLLLHLGAAGPVGDRAAAAEHERHAALEPLAEVEISGLHGRGRDRRGLAAGEKDVAAFLKAGLRAGQEGLVVGKEHVQQRELVRGQRHLVRGDHVAPRGGADLGHVEAVGADHAALAAEGAGVHGLVERMVAHDDLRVVVDLAGEQSGVFFVMSEVGAGFEAFLAVAEDAASRFLDGLLLRVALLIGGDAAKGLRLGEVGIELALAGALGAAHVARVEVLSQTVDRQGSFFRAEGRVQHALAHAADEPFFLEEHQLRDGGRVGEQLARQVHGRAEHVEALLFIFIERRVGAAVEFEPDVLAFETLELRGEVPLAQEGRAGAQIALRIRLLAENGDRIGLLFQLAREEERKEVRAEDRHGLSLFHAEHAAEL